MSSQSVDINKNNYIIELDGFRAIAVIAVMLVHWGVFGAGWIGVQMFLIFIFHLH